MNEGWENGNHQWDLLSWDLVDVGSWDSECRVKQVYRENNNKHFPCNVLYLFMLLHLKFNGNKQTNTDTFNLPPSIHCFPNRKTSTHTHHIYFTTRKKRQFIFSSLQIMKSNILGKSLLLSSCRNRLSLCKWASCYYTHLYCLCTCTGPWDSYFQSLPVISYGTFTHQWHRLSHVTAHQLA